MPNVKSGDLARIVECKSSPDAVGARVVVGDQCWAYDDELAWVCTSLSQFNAVLASKTPNGVVGEKRVITPGKCLTIKDKCLKRIDPDEEPQDILREVDTTV